MLSVASQPFVPAGPNSRAFLVLHNGRAPLKTFLASDPALCSQHTRPDRLLRFIATLCLFCSQHHSSSRYPQKHRTLVSLSLTRIGLRLPMQLQVSLGIHTNTIIFILNMVDPTYLRFKYDS